MKVLLKSQNLSTKVNSTSKLLMDTYRNLIKGKSVDCKVVSGIVNILCQSEQFNDAIEKVKLLETENIQTMLGLVSLEN